METSQDKQIRVDYDAGSDRFLIFCPVYGNDALSGLSSKRWLKAKRAWGAMVSRRNVEFISKNLRDTGLAAFSEKAHVVLDEALSKLNSMGKTTGFPAGFPFKTKPIHKQKQCLDKWYGQPGFACFMDRGTGKTFTAISVACALRMEGKIGALLVVCKLSGRRNWEEEWLEHGVIPASFCLPRTDNKKVFEKWLFTPHDMKVMVVGVESLSAGGMAGMMDKFCMTHTNVMMIIDESHLISNHKAARSIRCIEMRNKTAYRAVLTGTPISVGPLNLFSQFEFLDPDILGTGDFYSFRNRYAVMGGYKDPRSGRPMQVIGYQNMDELAGVVAPYVFELQKSEALDLPPKLYKKVYVELTKEQRALYNQIKKEESYMWAGKEVVCANVLGVALRLHQVCGGYINTYEEVPGPGGKIKRVSETHEIMPWDKNPKITELLDICADSGPTIIWAVYKAEITAIVDALRETYPKAGIREIHGGISEDDRNVAKDEFQSGECTYLVGNTATGGSSLTLTACETMIYYSNSQKSVDRLQSEDRAHRYGLTHSVLYIDLLAEKSIDITIMKALAEKSDLAEYVRANISKASKLLDGEIE
jgi:SNF2 family DNA or RNA helicase